MANIKYKSEDTITTVLYVLHFCSWSYARIAFRLALKYHYTDLYGKVSTHVIDKESLDLIRSVKDPIIQLINDSLNRVEIAKNSIAELQNLKIEDIVYDERILKIAANFYQKTIIDGIPLYDKEDDSISYDDTLDLYALSLVNVINWLFILVMTDEVDLEMSFDETHLYTDFLKVDYHNHKHSAILDSLWQLGFHLNKQHLALLEMH